MFTEIEHYITQMKLLELRKQRERLLESYVLLRQSAGAARLAGDKLRLLYAGLRQTRFADQPLHPEVANLEPLLQELDPHGRGSPDAIAFWLARLEKELERGQLRSEILFIFGALLEEWSHQGGTPDRTAETSRAIHGQLVDAVCRGEVTVSPNSFLDDLFAGWDTASDEAADQGPTYVAALLRRRVEPDELDPVLQQIGRDIYRPDATRRQAESVRLNPILRKEFRDALSIVLDTAETWRWPEAGVATHAYWTPNKWRLFLDDDLPTACLLEILGMRWQLAFQKMVARDLDRRLQRIRRLQSAPVTDGTLEQEVHRFGDAASLDSLDQGELWVRALFSNGQAVQIDMSHLEWLRRGCHVDSILRLRSRIKEQLRDLQEIDNYSARGEAGGPELALTLINAEIELARAAFPGQPVYMVKVDFKDYYASLPHDLLLAVLERYGLSAAQLEFFRRLLRIPLRQPATGEGIVTVQRGVPNGRRLSDLLGELVLAQLDRHVKRAARVRVIRSIDDMCLLAHSGEEALRAWQAVQEYAEACGLTLNRDKCGAVCIGDGTLPAGLPPAPPTWLLLMLDQQGQWRVNPAAFAGYLGQVRQQVGEAGAIVTQVQVYNANIAYLQKALAMRAPLGEVHRQSLAAALLRFHYQFLDEERGILDLLRRSIRDRFLEAGAATQLPESWFYWPLTAGGLGLAQVGILAASFAQGYSRRGIPAPPEVRPDDWQRQRNDWAGFFESLLQTVEPVAPEPSPVMETLVRDFIGRGAELTGGQQTNLSTYWRWILYTYGPRILDDLGTFRFLITELVPLRLIDQKYGQGVDTGGGQAEAAGEDPISF